MSKRTAQETHQEKEQSQRRAFIESMNRFIAASNTVGATPEALLQWVMKFATCELVGQEAVENARWEVWAFSISAIKYDKNYPLGDVFQRTADDDSSPFDPSFSEKEVPFLQADLKKRLNELRHDRRLWFPLPIIDGLTWHPAGKVSPVTRGGDVLKVFYAALFQLLLHADSTLKTCARPECENLFITKRSQRKYCDTKCENAIAVAKYRQTHPDLPDQQHERYKRKQQVKGRVVKVARRPRQKRLA